MTRSLLQPIRTRRVAATVPVRPDDLDSAVPAMTPGTRQTLAAIGALWVSFATSASVMPPPSSPSAAIDAPSSAPESVSGFHLNS